MKNNYDLILNFETLDGEPLSEDQIEQLLNYADSMAEDIITDDTCGIKIWKSILAQAVDSRKVIIVRREV